MIGKSISFIMHDCSNRPSVLELKSLAQCAESFVISGIEMSTSNAQFAANNSQAVAGFLIAIRQKLS